MTRLCDMHEALRAAVEDPTVALAYVPRTRFYGIYCLEPSISPIDDGFGSPPDGFKDGYFIKFCPFSGNVFPYELEDQWTEIIEKEFGEDHCDLNAPIDHLPEEFQTEEWWIKRDPPRYEYYTEYDLTLDQEEVPPSNPFEPYLDDNRPGMSRWPDRPLHICSSSENYYTGPRCMYAYLPHTREYGARILDMTRPVDRQPIIIMPVPYCPFCGKKLPPSLRPQWEERMRTGGFDPAVPVDPFSTHLPEELNSDKWWREAGL